MNTSIPAEDNVPELVEQLKVGLHSRVSDRRNDISDGDYYRIRRILLGHPSLPRVVPEFLKQCRSPDEVWAYINSEAGIASGSGSWAARRDYVTRELNPILDVLEGLNVDEVGYFQMIGPLGRGGFGQVYRYRHVYLEQDFAFKFFDPAFSVGGEHGFLERFFREARILFRLRHPNIIQVYDVAMLGQRPFIRMEFFDGIDLIAALRKYGTFSPAKSLSIISLLAAGLAHAHAAGVVHRDLKPANIMIARPEQLRIIDFGMGVFVEKDLYTRLTKTGQAAVGGHYTAPELVENPKLIDTRSDIYSVGAVWYELLVGRPPVGAGAMNILRTSDAIPGSHTNMILRCLADLDSRYFTIQELIAEMNELHR